MTAALSGLATGLALIVAIGAQNAFLLRQGVLRQHTAMVAAICIAGDVLLIGAGTAGVGAIVAAHPLVLTVAKWAGALYLVWFAIGSFRSAFSTGGLTLDGAPKKASVLATTLAITFLNPHVYLDTMVMLGSIANSFGQLRWHFAAGAMAGSVIWFSLLAAGARALAKPLANPRFWRYLDVAIGCIMLAIAVKLAFF